MLPRLAETKIRPALLCKVQVHLGWRNVYETLSVIQREVIVRLFLKVNEHLVVAFQKMTHRRNNPVKNQARKPDCNTLDY